MYTCMLSVWLAPFFSIEKDLMTKELEEQLELELEFTVGQDYHVGPRYAHVTGCEPTLED